MVKYQKNHLMYNKRIKEYVVDEDEESCLVPFGVICGKSSHINKRAKPKLLYFVFLSLVFCSLILTHHLLSSNSNFSLLYSFGFDKCSEADINTSICSSVPNGTICCDRSSIRSDICIMRGDVRTHSNSSSIVLYNTDGLSDYLSGNDDEATPIQHEIIRPYTRKWETSVMNTIDELNLIVKRDSGTHHKCDIQHDVPAVFFSTGGYTGNLYHEFNDGILPLYITCQHFNKKVVFVILEYHGWWITKYGDILSQLSEYPVIDFSGDKRVHCFRETIIGLRIHDELSIDSSLTEGNKSIRDFHSLLDQSYWPRISDLIQEEEREKEKVGVNNNQISKNLNKPKLVIVSRNGSRAITNEESVVKMAEDIGFLVEVLRPERSTELAKIYRVVNSSDVMVGVHGAAMTHFLFTKPGSVFIQVVPLGTDWAAETYYGEPARKLGLRYIGYKIWAKESSLYHDYEKKDPILTDPDSVNSKGWEFTKKIYLDRQTVRLDLTRFQKRLIRAYHYTININ
ncbi:hypothetical protein ACJIZ3_025864 [Penstemon smallii]|uniref:Glycosyltransferase 61 catalytic domain-containing protein n=1 Tax=Penstemon smallii TaxID=265156 RepID=A0ABD3TYA6_9LAMI